MPCRGGRLIAVGTTSLRVLETAARKDGLIEARQGFTKIFIKPGHHFRSADLLMTNFHLPKSTLFMLVCAFSGTALMRRLMPTPLLKAFAFILTAMPACSVARMGRGCDRLFIQASGQ